MTNTQTIKIDALQPVEQPGRGVTPLDQSEIDAVSGAMGATIMVGGFAGIINAVRKLLR